MSSSLSKDLREKHSVSIGIGGLQTGICVSQMDLGSGSEQCVKREACMRDAVLFLGVECLRCGDGRTQTERSLGAWDGKKGCR